MNPEIFAAQVLQAHWDGKLSVHVPDIAKSLGIKVDAVPYLEGRIASMYVVGGKTSIELSLTERTDRLRFALAHALGHIQMGHLAGDEARLDDASHHYTLEQPLRTEHDANMFALALLMPADALARVVKEKPSYNVGSLAQVFAVPPSAMAHRLRQLDLELQAEPA